MNDPISWLRPILAEEESDANGLIEAVAEARSKGLSSTIWDEQEADARRALRQVQAHRAILDWLDEVDRYMDRDDMGWHRLAGAVDTDRVRAELVSIYSDRDGYKEEWSR